MSEKRFDLYKSLCNEWMLILVDSKYLAEYIILCICLYYCHYIVTV